MSEKFKVIGTADINMERFREFRKEEKVKSSSKECWPAVLWQSYFYHHQDLCREAEKGYENCVGLQHRPSESFDLQVEKTCKYMKKMDQTWELLFSNEVITILRFGNFQFGLPSDLVECHYYTDLDDYTLDELRASIGTTESGMNVLVPNGRLTRRHMTDKITATQNDIENKRNEIKELEEKQRQEIERIKQEIMAKYQEQFDLINQKKQEMEAQMEQLENQLFILDTELYAIRCFMGETISFTQILSGTHTDVEVPVILYQKLRYLDEEMGKYLAIYDFDGNDISLFEEVLKYREDLRDIFAPPEKSISLIRISRNSIQYGINEHVANMLKEYETYHGRQIGILIRDGENLWMGWTDEDRINIYDGNAFLNPKEEITSTDDDTGSSSTKEEIASRYFVFSILQGVLQKQKMILLPDEASVFKSNPYVIYSMADGWLEDNRFGTFADIVKRINSQPLKVGDMVLTTILITRDDRYHSIYVKPTYMDAWNNDRGRGGKNRTHDAYIPDKTVLPVNLIDIEEVYCIVYDEYKCEIQQVSVADNSNLYTYKTERTNKLIKADREDTFYIINGYYDSRKKDYYNLKGMTEEEIYRWYLAYDDRNWGTYSRNNYIDPISKEGSYRVPKRIKKKRTIYHYFLSAVKSGSYWSEKKSYANMEIEEGEYLNLTYLNSVYVLYAIQNRKIGGWHVGRKCIDYANSIQYLNIALEYLRKREQEEERLLKKYIELYPDWQVDLSEWRIEHQYHRLTDVRAKKFAKYLEEGT